MKWLFSRPLDLAVEAERNSCQGRHVGLLEAGRIGGEHARQLLGHRR